MCTSFKIVAVLDGTWQVFGQIFDSGQRIHIAHQVGAVGDVTLDTVEQGVESLECRKTGRDTEHQFGIDYRNAGIKTRGTDKSLFIGILLRYNSGTVSF